MQTYTFFGKLIDSAFQLCHVLQDMTKNNMFSCHGNMTNDNTHTNNCQIQNLSSPTI